MPRDPAVERENDRIDKSMPKNATLGELRLAGFKPYCEGCGRYAEEDDIYCWTCERHVHCTEYHVVS